MKKKEFDGHCWQLLELAESIQNQKGPAYTFGKEDVLKNFKSVADRLNLTPLQVWGVYALKHFDAITSFAGDPNIPQAEDISGRFADAINYLKLGYALIVEDDSVTEEAKEEEGKKFQQLITPLLMTKLTVGGMDNI